MDGTRRPGLPRRPARHGGGRARRAAERLPCSPAATLDDLQSDRWSARAPPAWPWRRSSWTPGSALIVACDSLRRDPHRPRRLPGRHDERDQALARRDHQPGAARRRPAEVLEGTDLFIGLSGARVMPRRPGADEPRPVRLRDGQPDPRGDAGGGRAPRARDGHRPLRLPEPDQQRARLPGGLPRRAGRPRAPRSPRR